MPNLFTPSNLIPGILGSAPSLPRWSTMPQSPTTPRTSPCPLPNGKGRRIHKRKAMRTIPPSPATSEHETDQLVSSSPKVPVSKTPAPQAPLLTKRKRQRRAGKNRKNVTPATQENSTASVNVASVNVPTAQLPATTQSSVASGSSIGMQDVLLKLTGMLNITLTEEQEELMEKISVLNVEEALRLLIMLAISRDAQSAPRHTQSRPRVDAALPTVSETTREKIREIIKLHFRSAGQGVLYEKPEYAHVIATLKLDDDRGGLPEDWDCSAAQITAVSRCIDHCTSIIKAEMRRQTKLACEEQKSSERYTRALLGRQEEAFNEHQKALAAIMRSEYEESLESRAYWKAVDKKLRKSYTMDSNKQSRWLEKQIAKDDETYPSTPTERKRKRSSNSDQNRRKKQCSKAPSEEL